MREFKVSPGVAIFLVVVGLAALMAVEGITFWNMIYPPPPPPSSEHPFLAATYFVQVENVTNQNVLVRWNGWNDTWAWIDQGSKMLLDRGDQFQVLLNQETHAQINFYGYSYANQENYTVSVNVYQDGSKDIGPWSYTK